MMANRKEFRNKAYIRSPRFDYLSESDRYLFKAESPRYRFNVIGGGLIGREHMSVTLLEGRATIHGIFDPNPPSIEAARQVYAQYASPADLVVYDSLEAACDDPVVDGLIISTPNYTHITVVREAVKSGKHILLEKPMATTIADAYEIMQLANSYQAVFQMGLQYRYKAIYVEAIHEALERRSIGDIKTITILEHRFPFLDKVGQWNKFSKYSGGTLVEKCCHYFDLFNLFAQARPIGVFASGSMAVNFLELERDNQKSDIIDNAIVTVIYENGVRANFNLCMFAPMVYEELVLCGDEGRLKTHEHRDFLPESQPETYLEIMCGENRPSRLSRPSYPAYIKDSGHNGSTYIEHVNFVNNIEGRKTSTATAEEGFWSVVVGVAAEESIKTGELVRIDDLLEKSGVAI